jgi:hypothetical protein
VAGSGEHGMQINKSSGSIKGGKFLNKMRNHQLLKNDSVQTTFSAVLGASA